MREKSFLGLTAVGYHRVVYDEWGLADPSPAVVCVHGLTRNARDFDSLAPALAEDGRRVACPDVVGRGRSDWLRNADLYGYPQYVADMTALIARLDVESVDWVGTSMGGLIGMMIAAMPRSPIRRLVLNDVGPFVPKAALDRIAGYVGDPVFADMAELEAAMRVNSEGFGPLTDAQWQHLARHSARRRDDGTYGLAYDPEIARPLHETELTDVAVWPVWDAIRCPVLLLRGGRSDVLLAETAEEMTTRGPPTEVVLLPECGHAPMLMDDGQIAVVRDWLRG